MDLRLSEQQQAILASLDGICRPFEGSAVSAPVFAAVSADMESELLRSGFLDVLAIPELGSVTAALVIERLARLPLSVEVAASVMFRPFLGNEPPYPVCLADANHPHRPVRFAQEGALLVRIGETVTVERIAPGNSGSERGGLYAYPIGTVPTASAPAPLALSTNEALARWRAGLAAEAAGIAAGALAVTCRHVSDRTQFGKPIGTFQAIRHRLAEAEVRVRGMYWLAMKAAASLDPADTALAALWAQECATRIVYDFHQFLGAMGMTLEHPLHFYTYRLKLLIGDLGGRGASGTAAAACLWPQREPTNQAIAGCA